MSDFASGDFVYFRGSEDENAPEEIGLAVRVSANEKADGSKDEFVEVVPMPPKVLVLASQCRKFDVEPEQDGSEVVGSTSGEVGGIGKSRAVPSSKGSSK